MSGPPRVPMEQKFHTRYVRGTDDECWLWKGATNSGGYGNVAEPGIGGRTRGAHVVALELHTGEVAGDRRALHSCDTPACVNPRHLRWGTQQDNIQDAIKRGRHFTPFRRSQ